MAAGVFLFVLFGTFFAINIATRQITISSEVLILKKGQQLCPGQAELLAEHDKAMDAIIAKHKDVSGSLISVLHEIQQLIGYLPPPVQVKVAEGLGVPISEVSSVISFYALFSEKPKGKNRVCVCKGTACYVRGTDRILSRLENQLGIRAGDTTDDGAYSIEVVRCIGACGLGPVITINDDVYTRIKPDQVPQVLAKHGDRTGAQSDFNQEEVRKE
jgi:NADH:ubiquinone oxidoreductase subunit E